MSEFQDWKPVNIGNKSKSSVVQKISVVQPTPQSNNNTPEIITGDEKKAEKVDMELDVNIITAGTILNDTI